MLAAINHSNEHCLPLLAAGLRSCAATKQATLLYMVEAK
jgi:hypothetical protein